MDVSIIIPVHNAVKTIRECVLSILNSDFDKEFEIIVVDDSSGDNSLESIKDLKVRSYRQDNKSAAATRNAGAKLAKGDLLVFVDSDVVFLKDTLCRIYEHLKKDDVDYVSIRYSKTPANNGWIHRYRALADYCYYYDFIYDPELRKKPMRQVVISGGTEGYKKRVFEELGGFDPRVNGAGIEQEKLILELCRGYNMFADGEIRTRHYYSGFKKTFKDYFNRTFHTMGLVCRDSYSQPYLRNNMIRVALGGLTAAYLGISVILYPIYGLKFPFLFTAVIFAGYFTAHFRMFSIALRKYGFIFTIYAVFLNLFFCTLISFAGFLGILRNTLPK